jgi:hypothetical protein
VLKKLTMTCLAAGALVVASSGAASAGEITGNGKPTQGTAHAHSICAFSGQNDTPQAAPPEGGRTQSYGQLVRQGLKSQFPSPGFACNPNNHFGEE